MNIFAQFKPLQLALLSTLIEMAGSNAAVKPYPTIVFYGLKAIQLVFSVVAGATWAYTFFQLMKDYREVLGNFVFVSVSSYQRSIGD